MTVSCPEGHGAYGCRWQHGRMRNPQGTPSLAVIDLLGGTYIHMHGCHLSGYTGLYRVGDR